MPELYQVVVSAMGEVRDAAGNLVSSEPVEATFTLTAEELRELNLGDPQ
jgi:hypothetical protein